MIFRLFARVDPREAPTCPDPMYHLATLLSALPCGLRLELLSPLTFACVILSCLDEELDYGPNQSQITAEGSSK